MKLGRRHHAPLITQYDLRDADNMPPLVIIYDWGDDESSMGSDELD